MRSIPRLLLFLGLAWLTYYLFSQARAANTEENVDATRVVLLFGGVVLLGGVTGVLFVVMVMPMLGDIMGNLFFQPNEQIERTAHDEAAGACARGDYGAAVEAYQKALAENPEDTLAYSEIVKIQCEQFRDPAAGAATLEEALQQEWPVEDAAFLSSRLVDVYWKYQRDAHMARALLMQIVETMPGTRHASNAEHRLQEIERQISLEG